MINNNIMQDSVKVMPRYIDPVSSSTATAIPTQVVQGAGMLSSLYDNKSIVILVVIIVIALLILAYVVFRRPVEEPEKVVNKAAESKPEEPDKEKLIKMLNKSKNKDSPGSDTAKKNKQGHNDTNGRNDTSVRSNASTHSNEKNDGEIMELMDDQSDDDDAEKSDNAAK